VGGRLAPVAAWQRDPCALHRVTPSGILIAVATSDDPFRIEGAAAYVWNALETRATLDEIVTAVSATTDRSADEVRVAIAAALPQLESAGAIVRADD